MKNRILHAAINVTRTCVRQQCVSVNRYLNSEILQNERILFFQTYIISCLDAFAETHKNMDHI